MTEEIIGFDGRVYFTRAELACKSSGEVRLHPEFDQALLLLRLLYGEPMPLSSACRSAAHNRRIGGHPRSLHVYDAAQHEGQQGTLAVDATVPSDERRFRLLQRAWQLGWSVGVATTFLHLDRRDMVGLPQKLFGYGP